MAPDDTLRSCEAKQLVRVNKLNITYNIIPFNPQPRQTDLFYTDRFTSQDLGVSSGAMAINLDLFVCVYF